MGGAVSLLPLYALMTCTVKPFLAPFISVSSMCSVGLMILENNVHNKSHTLSQNYSNVLTGKHRQVSNLTGPSSVRYMMMGQQGSKHVGVCVLKHCCSSDEVCAISCSHCYC